MHSQYNNGERMKLVPVTLPGLRAQKTRFRAISDVTIAKLVEHMDLDLKASKMNVKVRNGEICNCQHTVEEVLRF